MLEPATIIIIISPHVSGTDRQIFMNTTGPVTLTQVTSALSMAQTMVNNNAAITSTSQE